MQQQPPKPKPTGQVFASFDDLVASRASSGAFVVPPLALNPPPSQPLQQQPQIAPLFPTAPILQPLIPAPSNIPLSPQSQALLSPRYDQQTQPFPTLLPTPTPLSTFPYAGVISPRYVFAQTTTTTTTTGKPDEAPASSSSFLLQPVVPQPLGQTSLMQVVNPLPPAQPKVEPHPSTWNPFWEDVKHESSPLSPRDDDEVHVHVVKDLSEDSEEEEVDEGDEPYDDRKYRNFQLRTSSHKLDNGDPRVEVVTTTTTFSAVPLTKSQEREQLQEGEYDYSKDSEHRTHHHRYSEDDGRKSLMGSDGKSIRFNWHPKLNVSGKIMKALIQVNCLVKGDYEAPVPKWLIPVDNTHASERAFDYALKLANPTDHIIIVHVREWTESDTELREAYLKWRGAVKLCRKFKKKLVASGRPHTILVPVHHDIRKIVVRLAKKFKVDNIVVGKHGPEDKKLRVKNIHFRSFTKYVANHAKHSHTMIV